MVKFLEVLVLVSTVVVLQLVLESQQHLVLHTCCLLVAEEQQPWQCCEPAGELQSPAEVHASAQVRVEVQMQAEVWVKVQV
jgi:hypothetical protein